jgi:hypothetical protein
MADKKGVLLHREVGVVECLKIHVEQKKLEVASLVDFWKIQKKSVKFTKIQLNQWNEQ